MTKRLQQRTDKSTPTDDELIQSRTVVFISMYRPLVVPFGRSAAELLPLCSRSDARSRGYLRANVTFPGPLGGVLPRHGLKQRRNSVNYPSIHPRQVRENCDGVLNAGQDCFAADTLSNDDLRHTACH